MQSPWIHHLGAWNPQLLREIRGRLKTRSILAAIALSTIGQVLLCLIHLQVQWERSSQEQWMGIWSTITWVLPHLLFGLCSYYLVGDITQEEKRGTLNFIRLSPRPGWQILLGKILGVPILPYLTLASFIPLHLLATLIARVPLGFMLSYYLLLVGEGFLCFSLALLYGLTSGSQPGLVNRQGTSAIAFGAMTFFVFTPLCLGWNSNVIWHGFGGIGWLAPSFSQPNWFYWALIPISSNILVAHLFTLVNLALLSGLIWRMLLRRFRQPRSTWMSKRQSYAIVAYLEILMVGFGVRPDIYTSDNWTDAWPLVVTVIFYLVSAASLVLVMFAIAPQRQALLDWSRYQARGLQSWLWADKSPMLLAMVIHLGMVYAILVPWTFLTGLGFVYPIWTITGFVGAANTLLMYGLLIQTVMAGRTRNPLVWAVGILVVWLTVPPLVLTIVQLVPNEIAATATLWTVLGYPFFNWGDDKTLLFTQIGLVGQWCILGGLVWQCDRTLKQLR